MLGTRFRPLWSESFRLQGTSCSQISKTPVQRRCRCVPAARADGHAALRAAGLAAARARGLQAGRVRRARARRVGPRRRSATSTRTWPRTCSRCSSRARSSAPCWSGIRWARPPRCASRSSSRSCVSGLVQITPRMPASPIGTTPSSPTGTGWRQGSRRTARTGSCACSSRPPTERWREAGAQVHAPADRAPPPPRGARATPSGSCRARRPSTGSTGWREIDVPALVVGSRDESDPTHPLAVAEEYARRLPQARARDRGRGRVAARVAGRAALARDPRLAQRVQDGAQPDDRRALRDGDLVVLRRAHREPLAARARRPARRDARSAAGCPRAAR